MKKIVAAIAVVLAFAVSAMAADSYNYPSKTGTVTFDHKAHAAKDECKACHGAGTPGKITLTKESAHKLCIGCHKEKKAGPAKCGECHKK